VKSKRIAIVGAGATGLFYGARLALAGHQVALLVRGGLDEIRARGVSVREPGTAWNVPPERFLATNNPREIGAVDLVLVTLKTTGNATLRDNLPPLLGPETPVVTLQNGLGNEAFIAQITGPERVLGGLCFIAVTRASAAELAGFSVPGNITLGEWRGADLTRADAIARLLSDAGVPSRATPRLAEARWKKLVWNIPFNGLSVAAGGVTTDVICETPSLAAEARALMREVVASAAACGIEIPEAFCDAQWRVTTTMGAYKPSSLVDFLAGRELELEAIWGEPLRLAKTAGAQTPLLEKLYETLKKLPTAPTPSVS
jgi:2-dehydropantoate 2-reductase